MFQEIDFIYDNIESKDMGLALVKVNDDNMIPFGTSQSIIETKLKGLDTPLFHGIERSPIQFPLTFAIIDNDIKWDYDKRQEIVNWLFQSDYKPFISADNPSIQYFLMAVGESQRWDNGIQQGYVTINFRMMSPYCYTIRQYEHYEIEQTGTIIELVNRSNIKDYKYYPILEFENNDSTEISFQNLTDGGRILSFNSLTSGETIYVDNEHGDIISSTGQSRYLKCNRNWLKLVEGVNRIKVNANNSGKVNLNVEMIFPMNF